MQWLQNRWVLDSHRVVKVSHPILPWALLAEIQSGARDTACGKMEILDPIRSAAVCPDLRLL
jgi:hypothetical protein